MANIFDTAKAIITDDMPDVGIDIFRPRPAPVAQYVPVFDQFNNLLNPRHCACVRCRGGLHHVAATA